MKQDLVSQGLKFEFENQPINCLHGIDELQIK